MYLYLCCGLLALGVPTACMPWLICGAAEPQLHVGVDGWVLTEARPALDATANRAAMA